MRFFRSKIHRIAYEKLNWRNFVFIIFVIFMIVNQNINAFRDIGRLKKNYPNLNNSKKYYYLSVGHRKLLVTRPYQKLRNWKVYNSKDMNTIVETFEDSIAQFPLLKTVFPSGNKLIYFDNAATSQKPKFVIDKIKNHLETETANVHRGIHTLSNLATEAFEEARGKLSNFINSADPSNVVFTKGATEAINLVANTWGIENLNKGDEIVLTELEHHANIVPWQLLAKKTGAILKFTKINDKEGTLDMNHFRSLLNPKTKLVAIAHASNVLGCINPVKEIVHLAHTAKAVVLLDACQTVPHMKIDVRELDVDFLVASGHKMCGPTGIGFLYGKKELLDNMPPWQGGGEMIKDVHLDFSTFAASPTRFEAGTPPIMEAVGLGAACDYLSNLGMDNVEAYTSMLIDYLYKRIRETFGTSLDIYGPESGKRRVSLLSFNSKMVHSNDIAHFLDHEGIAIRSGHHCAQPLHRYLGVSGSARISLYFYNTKKEIDTFIVKLQSVMEFFLHSSMTTSQVKKLERVIETAV